MSRRSARPALDRAARFGTNSHPHVRDRGRDTFIEGVDLRSIVFSVPIQDPSLGLGPVMEEAERLVGPLAGLYGRSKRLLGFEAIKVWVQRSVEETRMHIYLEARESVTETLTAGRDSTHPLDLELLNLFETITGKSWERVTAQWTVQILDWSTAHADARGDLEEDGS
jgi:hypothetical protein